MTVHLLFNLRAASQLLQGSELFYRPADLWVALFDEELPSVSSNFMINSC